MTWFFSGFQNFQLDVVGFLAILGEGSVASSAQMLGASDISYIPRLIPAPQVLLSAQRPANLPTAHAQVSAVRSGNTKSHVHYLADLLMDAHFAPHEVRCVTVTKPGPPDEPNHKVKVKAKTSGPLLFVTLLGCGLSIALLATSAALHDGMSLLATVVLSSLTTLAGYANRWDMDLPSRGSKNMVPEGNLVIRYPNGSFLIVECDENIARELYFAPEKIKYRRSTEVYQMLSLFGTSMLMLGVICLANAHETLQTMWAGSFILLNAAYWVVAALPDRTHWDLSIYTVQEHATNSGPICNSFTAALWKAIALCESAEWAELCTPARPQTQAWKTWTKRAAEKAGDVSWECRPQSALSPDQNLLWDYSGLFCEIPDWDYIGEFKNASKEHPIPPKRKRPVPFPACGLEPQQISKPGSSSADESSGLKKPDTIDPQRVAKADEADQTKVGAEVSISLERHDQESKVEVHDLDAPGANHSSN